MGGHQGVSAGTTWAMSFRLVFRQAARVEFEDAATWYESERRGLGEVFAEISRVLESVVDNPTRYPFALGDIRRTTARRFPFAIYFRLRGDAVVVLAVFHGKRDPTIWQRRR